MSEKLTIEGFAGIEHVEIDLRKINILIGPQATGKSIVAKLLYYFGGFVSELLYVACAGETETKLEGNLLRKFNQFFPPAALGNRGFALLYHCGPWHFRIGRPDACDKAGHLELRCSEPFADAFSRLTDEAKSVLNAGNGVPANEKLGTPGIYRRFARQLAENGTPEMFLSEVFLPAARSSFTSVSPNLYTLTAAGASIDPFLLALGQSYERARLALQRGDRGGPEEAKATVAEIEQLVDDILGAKYVLRGDLNFLVFEDGRVVDIGHTSSAQQEFFPLGIILSDLPFFRSPGNGKRLFVEEPEAHLFPTTQRLVVELLATLFNSDPERYRLVVTTHSPYVLTSLNNLLQAGQLAEELAGDEDALKRLCEEVPRSRHLLPRDVGAWYLDGKTARSIISEEEGLIEADEIDSVSYDLAVQFDRILDIGG